MQVFSTCEYNEYTANPQNRKQNSHFHVLGNTVVISFTVWIQTPGTIHTLLNKLQMLCFNEKLEKVSINIQLQWEN